MKNLVPMALLIGLTACGNMTILNNVPLKIVAVTIPTTLAPGADLGVTVRYVEQCNMKDEKLLLVARRPFTLNLSAVGTQDAAKTTCPAVYNEKTLMYVDSGQVNRTAPFEVIVNGKSWGKVEIK